MTKVRVIPILLLLLLLTAAAYYVVFLNHLGETPRECGPKAEGDLRVATINIARFGMISSAERNAESLLATLKKNDVDVLVIQEYGDKYKFEFKDFKKIFAKDYPYLSAKGEQAIVSKIPYTVQSNNDFDMESGSYASYVLGRRGDGRKVNLISVHLHTTGLSAMKQTGTSDAGAVAEVMSSNRNVRLFQAEVVKGQAEAAACPVIVAGDFNSMPLSKVYRLIKSAGLQDTFLRKGRGNGSTFRAFKDLVRIDYILPDGSLTVKDHIVCEDFLSDHRMVVATLSF